MALPAKLPVLLLLGAEGIAVGMSTRILPHNFVELLKAQIAVLNNQPMQLFPDFPTGGIVDVSGTTTVSARSRSARASTARTTRPSSSARSPSAPPPRA